MITLNQTEEQKNNFFVDRLAGAYLSVAEMNGGTGHLRKPLTNKEYMKRKNRNKMAKQSRKANFN